MRTRDRLALISMVVLSSVTASFAAEYVRGDAIVPQDRTVARGGSDTKTEITTLDSASRRSPIPDVADVEQRDHQRLTMALGIPPGPSSRNARPTADDTIREKTLAVLLLMLKDGRGAR